MNFGKFFSNCSKGFKTVACLSFQTLKDSGLQFLKGTFNCLQSPETRNRNSIKEVFKNVVLKKELLQKFFKNFFQIILNGAYQFGLDLIHLKIPKSKILSELLEKYLPNKYLLQFFESVFCQFSNWYYASSSEDRQLRRETIFGAITSFVLGGINQGFKVDFLKGAFISVAYNSTKKQISNYWNKFLDKFDELKNKHLIFSSLLDALYMN